MCYSFSLSSSRQVSTRRRDIRCARVWDFFLQHPNTHAHTHSLLTHPQLKNYRTSSPPIITYPPPPIPPSSPTP
jgi:hypothetical protein